MSSLGAKLRACQDCRPRGKQLFIFQVRSYEQLGRSDGSRNVKAAMLRHVLETAYESGNYAALASITECRSRFFFSRESVKCLMSASIAPFGWFTLAATYGISTRTSFTQFLTCW
jgi:hypothetical protein